MARLRQLVTSQDLASYFVPTGRNAQEVLPQLVRKLIVATAAPGTLGALRMASGDDIRLHGWDGRVRLAAEHPYVPPGESVWEMGVSGDPAAKAEEDYRKRTADPKGVDSAGTAFVFVTPHVWAGKQAWADERRAGGRWQDVRVIDGQVLSEWLDLAPAVARWFHSERATPIDEIDDVESGWIRVVEEPLALPVPAALVIGGRSEAASQIEKWLQAPAGDLTVSADSIDEVVAFTLAVVKEASARDASTEIAQRVLVARGRDAVHYLGGLQTPHIVIIAEPGVSHLRSARLANVSYVVPGAVGPGTAAQENSPGGLVLPPLKRDPVEKELRRLGYSEEVAGRVARESRGSLQGVLWGLEARSLHELPWLQEPAASQLAPLVLARRWPVASHPDQAALERLADRPYREIRSVATEWRKSGGPLQIWGDYWDWKAWTVAWEQLSPFFTKDLLDRFVAVCVEVLGTQEPSLELPAEDRWLAGIRGKVHPHSSAFRSGLVDSIAMFGALSDRNSLLDGQWVADAVLAELLGASPSAGAWLSLARWLPDLAEAAPEGFIRAAERAAADRTVTAELFARGGTFGPAPYGHHLLWALERLAWSPQFLGRVVVLLSRLAEAAQPQSHGNNPESSLRAILLPWHPGTSASPSQRLDAFDLLARGRPDVAWRCGLALLPSDHDTAWPTAEPRFRTWHQGRGVRPGRAEHIAFVSAIAGRLLALAGARYDRWLELIEALPTLLRWVPKQAQSAIDTLRALDVSGWSRENRRTIGETLRDLIRRHQDFPDAHWSLEASQLELLQPLAAKFAPTRPEDQHRWLFTVSPELPRRRDRTWEEERAQILTARREAVAAVRAGGGVAGLLAWMDEVESPEMLGAAVADSPLSDDEERQVLSATLFTAPAEGEVSRPHRFGYGFVESRERVRGPAWALSTLRETLASRGVAAAARFAIALDPSVTLFDAIDALGSDLAESYWSGVRLRFLDLDTAERAIPRLLGAGRPYTAMPLAAMLILDRPAGGADPGRTERLRRLCMLMLRDVPTHEPTKEPGAPSLTMLSHNLSQLLGFIEKHAPDGVDTTSMLARWEWAWLPLLEHSGRGLRTLTAELSKSPEFFAEILKLVYRPSSGAEKPEGAGSEAPEPPEAKQQRGLLAWKLLEAWRTVPGLQPGTPQTAADRAAEEPLAPATPAVTGAVDEAMLLEWITEARRLAAAADRLGPCDREIGKVLAYSPADPDGRWPCRPVRGAVEALASSDIERGLALAIQERRGVHSVGPNGDAERAIRDAFQELSVRIESESPRTAAVLREVAKWYDGMARQYDETGRDHEFGDA